MAHETKPEVRPSGPRSGRDRVVAVARSLGPSCQTGESLRCTGLPNWEGAQVRKRTSALAYLYAALWTAQAQPAPGSDIRLDGER
jgi:hypothetical protein